MKRREFVVVLGGAAAIRRLAPGGARAAGRPRAAHRRAHVPAHGRSRRAGPCRGTAADAAGTGLDRRAQRADRLSLERGRFRPHSHARGGTARARTRRRPGQWHVGRWALQQATRTVPIVFVQVTDPVGAGIVESLSQPGGNATGFTLFEYSTEREMAGTAQADRAGRDASGGPSGSRHSNRARPIRRDPVGGAVARGGVAPGRHARRRRDRASHHGVCAGPNGGLIVTSGGFTFVHRELIIALAARHRLPAVYPYRTSSPPAA